MSPVPPEINDPRPGGVLWVGRDPGRYEIEYRRDEREGIDYPDGRPFVGKAGELFETVPLAQTGFRRKEVNITNVVGFKPEDDLFKNHDERAVLEGVESLHRLVHLLRPRLIVTMGNEAAYALVPGWPTQGRGIFGAKGINDRRGYFWDTSFGTVLTILHPAGVLRNPIPGHYLLGVDGRRARRFLQGKLPQEKFPEIKRLDRQAVEHLMRQRMLGSDIETKWGNTAILCFAPTQRALTLYGEWKEVQHLVVGERLLAFEENATSGKRKFVSSTVEAVEEEEGNLLEIITTKGSLVVTEDHKVLAEAGHCGESRKSRTWKQARDLFVSRGPSCDQLSYLSRLSQMERLLPAGYVKYEGARILGVIARGRSRVVRVRTSSKTLIVEGFAVHNCHGFCGDDEQPYVAIHHPEHFRRMVLPILTSGVPLIYHNGNNFDIPAYQIVEGVDTSRINYAHDTQQMWWALEPELAGAEEVEEETGEKASKMTRKGLAFLASIYGNVDWWKDYPKNDDPDYVEKMVRINGIDSWWTRVVAGPLLTEIVKEGVYDQYRQAMSLYPALRGIHIRGLPIDDALRLERVEKLQERAEEGIEQSRQAALAYIIKNQIRSFSKTRKCECCGGGKKQARHCWTCSGFEAELSAKALERVGMERSVIVQGSGKRGKITKQDWLKALVHECRQCQGTGRIIVYDFKPTSPLQMKRLLYDHLGAPRIVFKNKEKADDQALRRVHKWALGR